MERGTLRGLFTVLVFVTLFFSTAIVYGSEKININTASETELTGLTGIGEGIAKRIIEYRDKYNGFKDISELQNVKGIGGKKFENIMELITTGNEENDESNHGNEGHPE